MLSQVTVNFAGFKLRIKLFSLFPRFSIITFLHSHTLSSRVRHYLEWKWSVSKGPSCAPHAPFTCFWGTVQKEGMRQLVHRAAAKPHCIILVLFFSWVTNLNMNMKHYQKFSKVKVVTMWYTNTMIFSSILQWLWCLLYIRNQNIHQCGKDIFFTQVTGQCGLHRSETVTGQGSFGNSSVTLMNDTNYGFSFFFLNLST